MIFPMSNDDGEVARLVPGSVQRSEFHRCLLMFHALRCDVLRRLEAALVEFPQRLTIHHLHGTVPKA